MMGKCECLSVIDGVYERVDVVLRVYDVVDAGVRRRGGVEVDEEVCVR